MQEIEKISSEVVHKNPRWEYRIDNFKQDGKVREYYYIQTPGSSMVVPILDDGRLLLVRQYRYLEEKFSIEFPCGGMNENETPSDAASRELLEETGFESSGLIKIGSFAPCNGMVKEMTHVFLANELTEVAKPQSTEDEVTEVLMRRVDEFENMIKQGEIWDGQVLAAWALVRDLLLKSDSSAHQV